MVMGSCIYTGFAFQVHKVQFNSMAVMRKKTLAMVAYWLIISTLTRLVNGAQHSVDGWLWDFPDGDLPYNSLQAWADRETFSVNDTLEFGIQTGQFGVLSVTLNDENTCNELQGRAAFVQPNSTHQVVYTITEPGVLAFISSNEDLCNMLSIKFSLNVSLPPSVPSGPWRPQSVPPPPGPGPKDINVPPAQNSAHAKGNPIVIVISVLTAVLLAGILMVVACIMMTRKTKWHRLKKKPSSRPVVGMSYASSDSMSSTSKEQFVDIEWPSGPQRFSYQELKIATKSFSSSQVLGEGGFGTVYKGFLRDARGSPVAVKRLSQYARQGAREFMAEVNIISQLRHRNLVQLLGWCDENDELILVYEYMPNGDVDDLIFGSYHDDSREWTPLTWKHRYNIFCGVATALIYLHEEWEQRVVHRDVKTSNVMLDSQFNARLGDFGLARLSAHSQAPRTTLVAGTIGYLAPEFSLTGRAMDKTDVYAFGVVILEVSCARRPLTTNCILVDWVWELHKEEKLLDAIDPQLQGVKTISDEEEMKRALQVGLLCCHPDPSTRPTMRHVLNILTGETPLPKLPGSKPVAHYA